MIPFELIINGNDIQVELSENSDIAIIDGKEVQFSIVENTQHRLLVRVGTKVYNCDNISIIDDNVSFSLNGNHIDVKIRNEEQLLLEKLGFNTAESDLQGKMYAPMPGKILTILVADGNEVQKGESILILEAMKMENELKSTMDGVIHSIAVKTGDSVEKNQILLEIKARG